MVLQISEDALLDVLAVCCYSFVSALREVLRVEQRGQQWASSECRQLARQAPDDTRAAPVLV